MATLMALVITCVTLAYTRSRPHSPWYLGAPAILAAGGLCLGLTVPLIAAGSATPAVDLLIIYVNCACLLAAWQDYRREVRRSRQVMADLDARWHERLGATDFGAGPRAGSPSRGGGE